MSNTTHKIALVTGGSRGLGRDTAIQLAKKGFAILITYQHNKEEAEKTLSAVRALGQKGTALQLDIGNSSQFDSFIASVSTLLTKEYASQKLDALVNNAGTGHHAAFSDSTESAFDEMSNIHLKGPFFLTQKLLPLLNDGSSIVNISSGLARFSYPGYAAYAIMKAGIESLSRYQAQELGIRKIRVNTLAPGAIATDFGGGAVRDNQALNDMIASQTALGRVGHADDIGSVAAFLCTDDAKWINAQRIEVAGGVHI